MITAVRVYDTCKTGDQYRVLVDRLWPRGISKEKAPWDEWMKDIGPSNELRKWFGHDPAKWEEFKTSYRKELSSRKDLLLRLRQLEKEHGSLVLLYSSKEQNFNNAVALKEFLTEGAD